MKPITTYKSNLRWVARTMAMASALMSGPALAAEKPMQAGEIGQVESIVDGDTLFLDNGLKVRLSAMQSPKLPLGREGFKAWPLSKSAKRELSELALGQRVQLVYGGLRRDRYDRALAQVYLLDDQGEQTVWLQEEMIRRGYGRVYTWPDTWQNSDQLFEAEREARAAKRGIWDHPFYAVRTPDADKLAQDMDSFQIVEGIVTSAAKVRGRVFLNFGADYRTDFTIYISKDGQKRFKAIDLDPLSIEGAKVRIRGWVEMENGPMIILDHPERLEILD